MGGQPNEQQQHVQYPVVYNDQQQQPNVHVQFYNPQVVPQYMPQVAYNQNIQAEQPVLQASSNSIYPQAPMVGNIYPQQPQPTVFQPVVDQSAPAEQPCQTRCRFSCGRLKEAFKRLNLYRVSIFATIFSALSYFLFCNSYTWPYFLLVAALSAGACGTKFLKEKYEDVQTRRFYIHSLWYSALNVCFVLTNLWSAGYPWSVYPLAIGGALVAAHALKIYNTNGIKKGLYIHFIIYVTAMVIMLVVCMPHGYRYRHSSPLVPMIILAVWSVIVVIHAKRVQRREQIQSEQPAELESVVHAAPVVNEAENAQLVHNQQEVYASIHQAQQEQREQQPQQAQLFQPTLYHPGNHQ